mmetsp:Transcript_61969/g.135522  ORF Transcript_61969/g.135522 Transcript_61969/m.135522 type:complete len:469 (-) Transcript_61969:19-1425(-)
MQSLRPPHRVCPCFYLLILCVAARGLEATEAAAAASLEASGDVGFDADVGASISDKVGMEVRLTKSERKSLKKLDCSFCSNIVMEMHEEVSKHDMVSKGTGSEAQVWETANAICFALLQKYRLQLSPPALVKKPEEEIESLLGSSGDSAEGADPMHNMLVLKMGCQRWIEDYGGDLSGFIFKAVKNAIPPADASRQYCEEHLSLCGESGKTKRKEKAAAEKERRKVREESLRMVEAEEAARQAEDPLSSLPEDSRLGLQRMLEMARDDPLQYMDEDAQQRIGQGRSELKCDVCLIVLEDVERELASRPRSMQSETDILPMLEGVCEGDKDLSVPSYFGVEPPRLPALWADSVRPIQDKKTGRFSLGPFGKKAAKARRKWRQSLAAGDHKPPLPDQNEADTLLRLTCKDMLDPAAMGEALFREHHHCASKDYGSKCQAALRAAAASCKDPAGALCIYPDLSAESADTEL